MLKRALMVTVLTGFLVAADGLALAADQAREESGERVQEKMYGSQLMTEQERMEYRNKMRAAKTAQEREKIRREHHESMKVRAKERGVMIPDEPPAKGKGMMGPGSGMGPGGGSGPRGGGMDGY